MSLEGPSLEAPEELEELPSGEVPIDHELPNIIDPNVAIEFIRQSISVMGANDSENAAIDEIKARLESGSISAQEAIQEANAIFNSKQDYH